MERSVNLTMEQKGIRVVKTALRTLAIVGTVLSLLAVSGGFLISASAHPSISKLPRVLSGVGTRQQRPSDPVVGAPAIPLAAGAEAAAVTAGGSAFSASDVSTFVTQNGMWRAESSGPLQVVQVQFTSSQEVSTLLGGIPTNQPSSTLLCLVKVSGNIVFANNPKGATVSSDEGYEVFNAQTGNFLMAGTWPGTAQDSMGAPAATAQGSSTPKSPATSDTGSANPLAYTISDTLKCNTTHCYGQNDWPGTNNGAETDIYINTMHCGGTACNGVGWTNGFLDNEVYVPQCSPSGSNCQSIVAWVEAGYSTFGKDPNETTNYFYAYDTNGGSSGYHESVLSVVPSGDYGNSTYFIVGKYSGSEYYAQIQSNNVYYFEQTGSFSFSPNDINIWQEDSSINSGSYAEDSYYNDNQYIDTGGGFHYQKSLGSGAKCDSPIQCGWIVTPPNSATGGEFHTYTPIQ